VTTKIIEFDEVCPTCGGTGVYIGAYERDGAGIVCYDCEGTGCHHFKYTYDEFEGRKITKKVKRVYAANPGICIGEGNGHKLEDFGGMPYKDWESGKPFPVGSEDRKHTCPAWWYQSADYEKKPKWKTCIIGGFFSECNNFHEKEKCWECWDREFGSTKKQQRRRKK